MSKEENEKTKEILLEITDRILSDNWEKLDELFDLIPETIEKSLLARKYFWKGRYFWDKCKDSSNAIYYFKLISKDWNESSYYSAKLWLGRICISSDIHEAREFFNEVSSEKKSTYYYAQYELAQSYLSEQKYAEAIECFIKAKDILKIDETEKRAQILHWLASTCRLNKQKDKAKEFLGQIEGQNSASVLVQRYLIEPNDENLKALMNIDDVDSYSYHSAQYYLGKSAQQKKQHANAIQHYLNVTQSRCWAYEKAQTELYESGIKFYLEEKNYNELKNILSKIFLEKYQYNVHILKKILDLGMRKKIVQRILALYELVEKIKGELQIKKPKVKKSEFDISDYCNKFAHYTSCTIAKMILGYDQVSSGSLQLSVADLMNDPTEGKILHYILEKPDWLKHRFNHRSYQAYASCFSFNHDSLNQFRLYGKESGVEVTGVSMVFSLNMFSNEKHTKNIINVSDMKLDKQKDVQNDSDNLNITQKDIKKNIQISKLPLYRCVYYDPKSGYYKLASRAEMTFYREGNIDGDIENNIKIKWGEYSDYIKSKELILRELFCNLKDTLYNIKELMGSPTGKKMNEQALVKLMNDILLPIQFLVKHAAFIEEDECRMLYITNASSHVIQEKNGRLYIEYEPSVVGHLDKIYLSDGAKDERAFLERAWQKALDRDGITDKSIDIRDSDNPFRI